MSSKKAQPVADDGTTEIDVALLNTRQRLLVEKLLATREFDSTKAMRQVGYAYPHVASCVKKFTVRRTQYDDGTQKVESEYEFWNKLEALDVFARILACWNS